MQKIMNTIKKKIKNHEAKLQKAILQVIICLLAVSCAKENDALVNPPLVSETVMVRFLNLSGDETPKTLVLERQARFENVPFSFLSEAQNPPFDSVLIKVFSGNNLEYEREQRQKFARKTNCIFVAVPSKYADTAAKNVDSVVIVQTTILKPEDTNQCYIKFLNVNPDTRITYSVRLGCPNGENVFSSNQIANFNYLQSSGVQEIYEGKRVVSIIKNLGQTVDSNASKTQLIGIFELDLKRLGQYILIVNKYDEVFFIDEFETGAMYLQPLQSIEERNAHIRIVNLSSEIITVSKTPEDDIETNLNSHFISQYNAITTCDAITLDKIILSHNDTNTDSLYLSFDVYQRYSIFAFDKIDAKAARIIAVPPISDRMVKKPDSAIVRIINGNYENSGITVSIGAREDNSPSNLFGYIGGDKQRLAVDLHAGEVSAEKYVRGGNNVPIAVFTTTQPTKYLFSSNINIEDGKEYVIAVDFSDGLGRLVAIEQNDEIQPFSFATQAAFLQIINVITGANQVSFSIPNLISNGRLAYTNSATTFVPLGSNSITINGKTHNFNATRNERILVIASNDVNNTDIFDVQSANLGATPNSLRHRFINASATTPLLQVRNNIDTVDWLLASAVVRSDIAYQATTDAIWQNREKKYTFFFMDQNILSQTPIDVLTDKEKIELFKKAQLLRVGDLFMTFNKNYSIIFHGNKTSGYGIALVQEY